MFEKLWMGDGDPRMDRYLERLVLQEEEEKILGKEDNQGGA